MYDLRPKIHIVGAPSAGKSTLGRYLADQLGCPYYDLDPIAFIDEHWTPRLLSDRLSMLRQIAAEPAWVSEGGHLGWTEPLLAAADVIVWLDPPLRVLLRRHWTRHRHRGLRWLVRYGWAWQVRWYLQTYKRDLAWDANTTVNRATTAVALKPWAYKTRRYRSPPSWDALDHMLRGLLHR